MIYTVRIEPLTLEADSIEQAQEYATNYFQDQTFEVRLDEIEEGDTELEQQKENTRQGRDEI